jgi:hypothetical protein
MVDLGLSDIHVSAAFWFAALLLAAMLARVGLAPGASRAGRPGF